MNTKLTYTAPECELVFTEQAIPLCQSGITDATLDLDPLVDDPTSIEWL